MTEQQPKILQIIQYIVQMPLTPDIVQMPATQDIVQIPATQGILQMAAQLVESQPLKWALGENRYLEFKEWNGSKWVDLQFWKDGTVPTKEAVSLHLHQWKSLCNMLDDIDDFLTRVIEKEPVDWQYHVGDKVDVTIKVPYVCVHIRKHFIPTGEWTCRPTKRGLALHFGEWKELKKTIPLLEGRDPELTQLVPLYRTD